MMRLNPSPERALMTPKGSTYAFPLVTVLNSGKTPEGYNVTTISTRWLRLSNVTAGSFLLAHELGHLRKIYGARQNDDDFMSGGVNNVKIWESCFKEITPTQ